MLKSCKLNFMKIKHFLILISLSLFLLSGCQENRWYNIPDECKPYVDAFIADAHENGYDLDFEEIGLIIKVEEIDEPVKSELYYKDPLLLVINEDVWSSLNPDDRKMLIYKDLAQGFLNRHNKNDLFENGEFASIMRAETDTTENTHVNFFGFRQTYYAQEVFNEQTQTPWWAYYSPSFDSVSFSQAEVFVSEKNSLFENNLMYNPTLLEISSENSQVIIRNKSYKGTSLLITDVLPNNENWELNCIMKIEDSPKNQCSGLTFLAENSKHYYACAYSPQGDKLMFNFAENHVFCDFSGNVDNPDFGNLYNEISVRRLGDFIYFFINHQFVYFTDVHTLHEKNAGFYIGAKSRVIINRIELKTHQS